MAKVVRKDAKGRVLKEYPKLLKVASGKKVKVNSEAEEAEAIKKHGEYGKEDKKPAKNGF